MDNRGPHEGAPVGPLDIPLMDKVRELPEIWNGNPTTSIGDQRKNNNRFLFLAVEYVEDQSKDFSRMYPYEQVSFSPRATSPLSEFEDRVSPLDPNMSSTARYSPTPVQLSSLPFQNSVVVLQDPPSPLIVPPVINSRENINFINDDNNPTNISDCEQESASDFVNSESEQGITTDVNGELILINGNDDELEGTTAPLMLTELPVNEFTLTRDFLVMNDEQLNVINSIRNHNNDDPAVVPEFNDLTQQGKINIITKIDYPNEIKLENDEINEKSTKNTKINDKKTYGCDDCDSICLKDNDCTCKNVRAIADQPVPSRAIATLPGSYLSLNKLIDKSTNNEIYGVFAKKPIRKRTQFGPIEGILCQYDGHGFNYNELPLLYETNNGELLKIDVTNENSSNWMRFVRPALTKCDENLIIFQQNDGIVFLTTRNILPNEELRAGPSHDYALRRNLSIIDGTIKVTRNNLNENLTNNHYDNSNNDIEINENNELIEKNKLLKMVDEQTLKYNCPQCTKVFPRNDNLKKHMLIHCGDGPNYECQTCGENFLHSYNRTKHMKLFHSDDRKEKENSRENLTEFKCNKCKIVFLKLSLLDIHNELHNNSNNNDNYIELKCPQCNNELKTKSELIKHVTSHGDKIIDKKSKQKLINKTTKVTITSPKCKICYKRFATTVRLQQHYLVHGAEDQKPLPCNVCLKRFMNNSALSCHLKTHCADKKTFECPMCRKLFDQLLLLKEHIETHKNIDKTFNCPNCPRKFTKYSVIRKHIRSHHCERKHNCQFCPKRFPTIDKLRMHLLRHSDHRQFQCANCDKQFKRKDKLKEHITRMHNADKKDHSMNKKGEQNLINNDNNSLSVQVNNNQMKRFIPKVNPTDYNRFIYKCHQCLVGFKRRGMLVNHLAKRHPDVSPQSIPELNLPIMKQTRDYYCQYCEKVYKSSSKRKAHIMKNHPGAELPPSNRKKETIGDLTYSQAAGSITTSPQNCQWCHKQYASKAKLLQHQRKKHPNLMEPADQVPRPRNRPQNQLIDQNPNDDNNFIVTELIGLSQICEIDGSFKIKPKIIKINDVDLINIDDNDPIIDQQFVRMRDIR